MTAANSSDKGALRLLSASLAVGAFYDFGLALLLAAAPQVPARWLSLPLPGESFYLWVLAILLTMLGTLYLVAARDPRRHGAIIAVAVGGRLAGAVALELAAIGRPELRGLHPLAAADGALGMAHGVLWWRWRS